MKQPLAIGQLSQPYPHLFCLKRQLHSPLAVPPNNIIDHRYQISQRQLKPAGPLWHNRLKPFKPARDDFDRHRIGPPLAVVRWIAHHKSPPLSPGTINHKASTPTVALL